MDGSLEGGWCGLRGRGEVLTAACGCHAAADDGVLDAQKARGLGYDWSVLSHLDCRLLQPVNVTPIVAVFLRAE